MRTLAMVVLALTVASGAAAQSFEVVSVRPTTFPDRVRPLPGGDLGWRVPHPPGRFEVDHWSIRGLIAHAYALPQQTSGETFTLRGGDGDILDGHAFHIEARLPDGVRSVSLDEERAMLRALLADRFGLRVHIERQQVPVYALRRVGHDLGRGLQSSDVDCMRMTWQSSRTAAPVSRDSAAYAPCLEMRNPTRMAPWDPVRQREQSSGEIAALIRLLQGRVDRPIVDETGLTGLYAWNLVYEVLPTPNLTDALEDQLHLTLARTEAEADIVVIDAVSLPTPN